MKVFFDSSALVHRYVPERGTEAVLELCRQATELGVSVICLPEIISALNRLRREKKLGDAGYHGCLPFTLRLLLAGTGQLEDRWRSDGHL